MINFESKKEFKIALISTLIFILLFFILGLFIWNGETPVSEKDGFCEAKRTGLLKEPMNSLSSLSYVLVGLYILYIML